MMLRTNESLDHNNGHTVDFHCEISGGNVMCAVTHPQFANYGQVLLKIHNDKEEKRHVLLRTAYGVLNNHKEAFFHVEQLRVKDDAEDDDEDYCFHSYELFKDKMDNSKSDVDLHFLNAKKFHLTRMPSKLNEFESSENGYMFILPPHSKGPVYYAVRMTFALENMEGETKIIQYPRGLNGDGKIDTTYFPLRDANNIKTKHMRCITVRKTKKPSTPCGTYKFRLFDYSGKRKSQHFSPDDFKKHIYTSEEFVIGKLKFGTPKGYKTIGTNKNPLPEKIEKYFRGLEKKTKTIRQVLKLCIKDENFDNNYRMLTEKALEAIVFCLCLGDTESIWGDKWPNVFDMDRTEQYKDVRFRLKVHSQRKRLDSLTIYRHWWGGYTNKPAQQLEEEDRFTDNFRNLKNKLNHQPPSIYKSGYELKNDKKTLAFVNTGTDNEEVNVLNFFMFDVKKLRIKMREDAERKRQLETPMVHEVLRRRGSLRRFTVTHRKRKAIPRNNSLQNLYPYADVEYRISDNSNQTKKAVFSSPPDTTATVRRLSPSHLSPKRRRLFNQEQTTSGIENSFNSYNFHDDLNKETMEELFKYDLEDDLIYEMIEDNQYSNLVLADLEDDISKLFD